MEQQHFHFSFSRLSRSFRSARENIIDPDFVWKIILGATLCGATAIGIVAYLTFTWAISPDAPPITVATTHGGFSIARLEQIIGVYRQKEQSYEKLLHNPPVPPNYRLGSGPNAAPSTETLPIPETSVPSSDAPPSPMPNSH